MAVGRRAVGDVKIRVNGRAGPDSPAPYRWEPRFSSAGCNGCRAGRRALVVEVHQRLIGNQIVVGRFKFAEFHAAAGGQRARFRRISGCVRSESHYRICWWSGCNTVPCSIRGRCWLPAALDDDAVHPAVRADMLAQGIDGRHGDQRRIQRVDAIPGVEAACAVLPKNSNRNGCRASEEPLRFQGPLVGWGRAWPGRCGQTCLRGQR